MRGSMKRFFVNQPLSEDLGLPSSSGGRAGRVPSRLSAYSGIVVADSPWVFYRFQTADGATSITDSSGNARTGTGTSLMRTDSPLDLMLDPTAVAYFFNGGVPTSSSPTRVGIATLDVSAQSATGVTMEAWICPSNTTQDTKVFGKNTSAADLQMNLSYGAGKMKIEANVGAAGFQNINGVTVLVPGQWYLVHAVWDGLRRFEIWVNGVRETNDTTTYTSGTMNTTTGGLSYAIGTNTSSGIANAFKGGIAEPAIYLSQLGAGQIRSRMAAAGYRLKAGGV